MKTSILIFASFLFFSSLLVRAQNDSLPKIKKKQIFIGVNAAGGMGWRRYKPNIPDSLILHKYFPKTETPGIALGFNLNCGLINKKSILSIGLNYFFAEYNNNSNNSYSLIVNTNSQAIDTITVYNYNYKLTHRLVSIPIGYYYLIGNKKRWQIGCSASLGILYQYERKVKSSLTQIERKNDLVKKLLITTFGLNVAKKLVETSNFVLLVDLKLIYTSKISTKSKILGTPNETNYYTSKPNYLIISTIGLNLLYKI